jgi:signal transduction histidine kinase
MQPPAPVNLAEIAREVLLDLEIRVEDTQGQVILGSLPTLDADPLQMRQLFQNLIGNALKFHRPDQPPVVRVDAQVETNGDGAEQVRLTFADNGIGFDERYLERIFQPFYRLHGRAEYEGTGMGLAICRKIVERHNGSITAASQIDGGTIFTILLPRHPQPEGSIQPPTLA